MIFCTMVQMEIERLRLDGLLLITPQIFGDERGFFLESYNLPAFEAKGLPTRFVQDNLSCSKKNTIRGLHYQSRPGQAKLISCLKGKIWDVAVDIRPDSPTFGQWQSVELDDQRRQQFFIPVGFAHGFCVLSESALVQYKVSAVYDGQFECSIRWNDPKIGVNWPIREPLLSPRDQLSPYFTEVFHAMGHR